MSAGRGRPSGHSWKEVRGSARAVWGNMATEGRANMQTQVRSQSYTLRGRGLQTVVGRGQAHSGGLGQGGISKTGLYCNRHGVPSEFGAKKSHFLWLESATLTAENEPSTGANEANARMKFIGTVASESHQARGLGDCWFVPGACLPHLHSPSGCGLPADSG